MTLEWEALAESQVKIGTSGCGFSTSVSTCRAKVPDGWLVVVTVFGHPTLTFYPDPEHHWGGAVGERGPVRTSVAAGLSAVPLPTITTFAPLGERALEYDPEAARAR